MDLSQFKTSKVLKFSGLAILAIIVIALAFNLIGSSFKTVLNKNSQDMAFGSMGYSGGMSSLSNIKMDSGASAGLSERNVVQSSPSSIMPLNDIVTGNTSEQFEVTEYNASIETRQLDESCIAVSGLKAKDYVIFENANRYDKGCNYRFKVKKDNVEEILEAIKSMNPKEISENTYTIKRLVDDYTAEADILKKKLATIDETLSKAMIAYDEVTVLATRVQNVESLTKIVDSKINLIEKLTQERININSELDRINRSKAEQLDRLEYTYFNVNVYENKFIEWKSLSDSWKATIKKFVFDVNRVVQDISVNLVSFLFMLFQYAIYVFILLVVIKYGWKLVKYIWYKQ
jgi:hypothetical protein